MLLLTGQRVSEVAEAEWDEFDLAKRRWTIPSHRNGNKSGESHQVYLSDAALATFWRKIHVFWPKAGV
jgi:integrase